MEGARRPVTNYIGLVRCGIGPQSVTDTVKLMICKCSGDHLDRLMHVGYYGMSGRNPGERSSVDWRCFEREHKRFAVMRVVVGRRKLGPLKLAFSCNPGWEEGRVAIATNYRVIDPRVNLHVVFAAVIESIPA